MKLESRLRSTSNRFDKIFILLEYVERQFPSITKYVKDIKRDFEIEIGALDLDKQEIIARQKELQMKADQLTEIEVKNLENNVYLENKIQELNMKLGEINQSGFDTNTIELVNCETQTVLTCDVIRETELELLSCKKNLEIDLLVLNDKIKAKEKEFKFDYGKFNKNVIPNLIL